VCAYDRPGVLHLDKTFSRSDPVPQPTNAQDGVDDLVALPALRLALAGGMVMRLKVFHCSGVIWARNSGEVASTNTIPLTSSGCSPVMSPDESVSNERTRKKASALFLFA
jgi:hypothetical protein